MLELIRVGNLSVLHAPASRPSHPPVLFVHGYFATAAVFEAWMPFFAARGVPAFAVNLRGRSGSGPSADLGAVTIDDFVEDAATVARYLDGPAVVGHSMGGLIAQRLAERHDVKAAVLITPAPPRGISVLSPRLTIKQLEYLPSILRSRPVHPSREGLRQLVMNCVPGPMQDVALDQLVPDSGRAGREMALTGVSVDAALIRCPMLAIAAEHDRYIPRPIVGRIAKRYGIGMHTMAGHGHMVPIEPGWETLADLIDRWLRER